MKPFFLIFLLLSLPVLSGFDFSKHSIPISEILSGGPPKDGIPAILEPRFIPLKKADFLKNDDRVLGLVINGESKAYPVKILNWHEIVNDVVGGMKVIVSYCPLCGTGMAFDSTIKGKHYTFGVSGLLYKSDVLMYDHQTESLWSQISRKAVTGPQTGTTLKLLPLLHTSFGAWKQEHPNSVVLSDDTGYRRDYDRDPYVSYSKNDRLLFPVGKIDKRYPTKTWVIGIEYLGVTKAYPFPLLSSGPHVFNDRIGSEIVQITYDPSSRSARIRNQAGEDLPSVMAYWFAWTAFHPETEVYQREEK